MFKIAVIITWVLALAAGSCPASSRLFYLEAQAVGGYAFTGDDRHVYWYSMDQMDVMQKPSLGFDYIQRFSGAGGDWGMLAVQARLAYNPTVKHDAEPQLYNAYLKVKPGFGDIWLGHNKPAFGLASYLDNHGTLLQPLSMYGFGYDRDWGAGYYRDFQSGNLALSATTGSGMPLYFKENYLLSGRVSKGDLNQQNYNAGMSFSYGQILKTMGYMLPMEMADPVELTMTGLDGSFSAGRWENRIEILWHRVDYHKHHTAFPKVPTVLFHRITANFLSENRLKCELQSIWRFEAGEAVTADLGISYHISSDIIVRSSTGFRDQDVKTVVQLYWYHKI
jgi:hypothetical protein